MNARWYAERHFVHLNRMDGSRFSAAYPDDPERRFWEKIDKTDGGCWLWRAGLGRDGYGKFLLSKGRTVSAHRHAWELARGAIPAGMLIIHSCDNRLCCNPDHMRVGTQAENMADMDAKGRRFKWRRTGVPRAKLAPAQAAAIKSALASGVPLRSLAREFNISIGAIRSIRDGRTWKEAA